MLFLCLDNVNIFVLNIPQNYKKDIYPMKYAHSFVLICCVVVMLSALNALRLIQDDRQFTYDIFNFIFFNENICIMIQITVKCVSKGPIDSNAALVWVMA